LLSGLKRPGDPIKFHGSREICESARNKVIEKAHVLIKNTGVNDRGLEIPRIKQRVGEQLESMEDTGLVQSLKLGHHEFVSVTMTLCGMMHVAMNGGLGRRSNMGQRLDFANSNKREQVGAVSSYELVG
jgi:hypothetical protein